MIFAGVPIPTWVRLVLPEVIFAGVPIPTWVDLVIEANFAVTLLACVGLVLVWREVFPAPVRPGRRKPRRPRGPDD